MSTDLRDRLEDALNDPEIQQIAASSHIGARVYDLLYRASAGVGSGLPAAPSTGEQDARPSRERREMLDQIAEIIMQMCNSTAREDLAAARIFDLFDDERGRLSVEVERLRREMAVVEMERKQAREDVDLPEGWTRLDGGGIAAMPCFDGGVLVRDGGGRVHLTPRALKYLVTSVRGTIRYDVYVDGTMVAGNLAPEDTPKSVGTSIVPVTGE